MKFSASVHGAQNLRIGEITLVTRGATARTRSVAGQVRRQRRPYLRDGDARPGWDVQALHDEIAVAAKAPFARIGFSRHAASRLDLHGLRRARDINL